MIIEIRALPLAENGVIFRYKDLRGGDYSGRSNFLNGRLAFCGSVPEEEINLMKENALPRNTKHIKNGLVN